MRLITLPDSHTVLLYQTPQELPAGLHSEFQHWCLRAAGIGSGPGAIDAHFATTGALLAAGRVEEAADALALLHYSFNDSFDNFSSRQLAFGCLVAEVDGQPWTDRSETGLQRLLALLSSLGLSEEMVATEVADVKKNWRRR
jgi:hypothetical protein